MPLRRLLAVSLIGVASLAAQPTALSVNTASREEVRQFYRAVYFASENVPMNWTGSYNPGAAGDTAAAFKEATRLRINFFRALAGVPADVTFHSVYSAKAQQTALMLSANKALDHFPPPTWTFYTPEGAEAAASSNLALGSAGPASIDGYVADAGANNAVAGHRRWLFYPQTLWMGTGDVAGDAAHPPANALWVVDTTPGGQFGAPRPPTRTPETAYPPAGFVPYPLVWPRWSFAHPGADFSAATVTMTRNGQPVVTALEPLSTSPVGEPTLVWVYDGQNPDDETPHPRPASDTVYDIQVDNVRLAGAARDFAYRVVVFDPAVAGPDATPVAVSGPATAALGRPTSYAVTKPTFAPAFEWRALQLASFTKTYTAEAGLDGLLTTTTAGYEVVQRTVVAAGSFAFRLAHQPTRADELLQFPGSYLLSSTSALTFQSRLGIATPIETARAQISLDDGNSWIDVFTQTGTSALNTSFPAPTETNFVGRTIPLSAYAGRTARIRLVYSIAPSGAAYLPDTTNSVGWFVDHLALTDAHSVSASAFTRVAAGTTFTVAPTLAGPFALQARGLIADAYPLEWGPIYSVVATSGDAAAGAGHLTNLSVRTTAGSGQNTLIVGFTVSGGTKPVLVRGVGPGLAPFGVSDALADPKLELFDETTKRMENDNWLPNDASVFRSLGAFELASNSGDAALVAALAAGSYTAQLSGRGNTSGVALVELYDAGGGSGAKLGNVSARSRVGAGDGVLIAGFTIAGTGARTLLIRAVGPTLAAFNVVGPLADPQLELFQAGRASPLAANDDWDNSLADMFGRVGAFPLTRNSKDAMLVVTLPPGSYTAQVSGTGNSTGVGLVEVYEIP